MTIHEDARNAAQTASEKVYDDAFAQLALERDTARESVNALRNSLDLVTNERDTARRELADHMATHQPDPDPDPEPAGKTWLLGMATEKTLWPQRAATVGHPVNVRRRFEPNWQPASMVAMAKECRAVGCLPYISMKLGAAGESSITGWQRAASGAYDADFERIGRDLAALGYKVRASYHHEPRTATIDQLVVWAQANARAYTRMRAGAGDKASNLILGPIDNGFPWSTRSPGGVTKTDLDRYYTDTVVSTFDVCGADFYDGATNTNPGEPAWIKMDGFRKYWDARGFQGVNNPGWKYDCGEYQIVDPEDCDALWTFLTSTAGKDFDNLAIFNSAANNRDDIPDRIGGTWVLSGTRLEAFRRTLVAAGIQPVK